MTNQNIFLENTENPNWDEIMDAIVKIQSNGFAHNYSEHLGVHRVYFISKNFLQEVANGSADVDMKTAFTEAINDFSNWYSAPKSQKKRITFTDPQRKLKDAVINAVDDNNLSSEDVIHVLSYWLRLFTRPVQPEPPLLSIKRKNNRKV